ncbi:MAG TPA: hypothetical protein VEP90_09205 [Methylomirabilota bacterium]|nr:hypothetical protein [Methylomirabilota bacterium]
MTDALIRILDKLMDLAKEQVWAASTCITSGILLFFYQHQHIDELVDFNIVWSSNITEKENYRALEVVKFRYTIKPWASKYLQKHPELLKTS